MRQDVVIRPERAEEFNQIDQMVCDSFTKGTNYSNGVDVVDFIHEIRDSKYYIPALSFVATVDGDMAGHFMFSYFPLSASEKPGEYDKTVIETPIVMLAPVAVAPPFFRQGVGTAMITQGLGIVRDRGFRGAQVEGSPAFYHRFGFRTSSELGFSCVMKGQWLLDHPECMMMMEMHPGAMKGMHGYIDYSMYKNA